MNRIVLIFGLIIGTILSINMLITVRLLYTNPDFQGNEVVGYTAMVVLFSLIYFGVRNYRNKQLGGVISFGKAFKMGALIALVGSTIYVITWLFCYYLFVPDFFDQYMTHVLNNASPSEIAAKTKEMETYREMYKNPFFVVLFTYLEILPIGLIIALISALIVKRKPREEAQMSESRA